MNWIKEFPGAITVCDTQGIIVDMNDKACKVFERFGGSELIGKNVLDCHPEKARNMLEQMLKDQTTNCYTIEKNDVKKLIYQAPWHEDGIFKGFVELSLEIPFDMPHHKR